MSSRARQKPGETIQGRYRILRPLTDEPGTSSYLCQDDDLAREVVLECFEIPGGERHEAFERFEREVSEFQRISTRGITAILDHFYLEHADGGASCCLVAPHIDGTSLGDVMLRGQRRLSDEELRALAWWLIELLERLHQLEPPEVHGDIKPSNIYLGGGGEVTLRGFWGICHRWRSRVPRARPRDDLHSLGVTLFHLITSTPPEDASDRNARESTLRRSECPEDLVEFIVCLLEPEERGRPTTAREARALLFAQALKVQLEGEVTEGLEASSRLLELEEPPREEDELYREVRRMLMPDFFGRAHAISGIAGAGSDFNITNAKGIFLFIVGLFSVVVPFYQLAYYGWVRRKYRGLLEEGSYTRGKVLAVHLPLKHNYGCWIDYAYARDGEIYTGRVNVQSASRSGLVAGGQVGVLYDNANPKRSVIIFYDAAWGL